MSEDELMFDQAAAAAALDSERRALRAALAEAVARRDAAKHLGQRKRLTTDVDTLEKKLAELEKS